MGQVIDFETRVDRPCDTEDPSPVEGYRLNHFQFDNPNVTEPTSSNPFPWVRIHHHNGKCWVRWQRDSKSFEDKEINEGEALRMIADLALFVRLKGLK